MKKITTLITFAILVLSAFSLQAGVKIGVKAGVNLANAALKNGFFIQSDNFTGFQAGPIIEISGLPLLDLDIAVLYSQSGIKTKAPSNLWSVIASSSYPVPFKYVNYEEKASALDIPANLKYKISLLKQAGIYFTAGPYVSFNLNSQVNISQNQDLVINEWKSKKFGVGLNFGAGFELLKHLQIGFNYQFALNDDYGNFTSNWTNDFKNLSGKTRIRSITAAYFF